MIMEMLPVVYLTKPWPPLQIPPVKEGWCKLCGDRPVTSGEHRVAVEFAGGWRFMYPVCATCYQAAYKGESAR